MSESSTAVRTTRGSAWSIEETAVRLGGYAWVENRLFEVLGQLVSTSEVSGQLAVGALAHAAHLAWHAELWRARVPILPHLPLEKVVAPPSPQVELILDSSEPGAVLVAVYRVVLPGLLEVYAQHLARAVPVTDGPVIRTLGLVLADERADLSEGEGLVGASSEAAGAVQAQLAALWAAGTSVWDWGA